MRAHRCPSSGHFATRARGTARWCRPTDRMLLYFHEGLTSRRRPTHRCATRRGRTGTGSMPQVPPSTPSGRIWAASWKWRRTSPAGGRAGGHDSGRAGGARIACSLDEHPERTDTGALARARRTTNRIRRPDPVTTWRASRLHADGRCPPRRTPPIGASAGPDVNQLTPDGRRSPPRAVRAIWTMTIAHWISAVSNACRNALRPVCDRVHGRSLKARDRRRDEIPSGVAWNQ